MKKRTAVGLRKGSWTTEEDTLLRKCVEKFGEGKWHLVPFRAGLNRCRKSCRLRWLNYLRPDIKRGYFNRDEVDLIIRLHKLLGNRWSLIAGRLPGRTANDVKNFWNTHVEKKSVATAVAASTVTFSRECNNCCRTKIVHTNDSTDNIIKPRPRKFFKPQAPIMSHLQLTKKPQTDGEKTKKVKPSPAPKTKPSPTGDCENPKDNHQQCSSLVQEKTDESIQWWKELLEMTDSGDTGNPFLFPDKNGDHYQVPILSLPNLSENSWWDAVGYGSLW